IEGNGRLIERQVDFDGAVSTLKLGKHLVAKVQIEQTDSGKTTLFYSGDENFVKSIREDLKDNRLELTGKRLVSGVHNLNIRIQTPKLSRIEQYSVGTISLEGAFTADTMEVEMNSVGNIDIKSLTATLLTVNSDGVGSVEVAGHARKATLKVKGVGGIDALELVADTVIARVEGLASIRCNPVTYLNASLRGIGSITYKDNPASKTTTTVGLGHVGKD
ncbi:MAG: DUF2807 domain-containing protein, partial [Tannerella sp.]|nr:DUF2807 domain-containing protein [Tannerella sp.]